MPFVALFNAQTNEELSDTRQWVMEGEERVLWSGRLLPPGLRVYIGVWEEDDRITQVGQTHFTSAESGYDMEATLTWIGQ